MLFHALIPTSRANGPGLRAVVFFQGCGLRCKNCWNETSHPFEGRASEIEVVAERVLRAQAEHSIEGVTFSGGEPMQQADSLLELMRSLRGQAPRLSFGMFSGYTERELDRGRYSIWLNELDDLRKCSLWQSIRAYLDFAVFGRFNYLEPGARPLRSSRNQVLRLFSSRYQEADFSEPITEVHIDEKGAAEVTGFPVLGLPW